MAMTNEERDAEVQRRLRLSYHRVISGNPDEGYLGEVAELHGCLTAGETPAEALTNLDEAMAAWFEAALMTGMPIPDPAAGARVLLSA
jgi:predicted RNase H-like HicB family nuclease